MDEVFEEYYLIMGVGVILMFEDFVKGDMVLKVLFYNGGWIVLMIYRLLGYEWMEEGMKNGGYEEFSGIEF